METRKIGWVFGVAASLSLAGLVSAESEREMMREAKVDRMHAERIAVAAAHGGKVVEIELEREHGKLIWSCDVVKENSKMVTDVEIDAKLGKVLSVKQESAAKKAKDAAEEKKNGGKEDGDHGRKDD